MKNKGGLIAVVILVIIVIYGISTYNGLVGSKTEIEGSFANIDVQLQRRGDLIPNLLNTVKGYMAHEKEVIASVADARAKLAGASTVSEKQAADTELSSALSRLLMVVENYPNLKADTQFTALRDELAGTENRIAVARKDYNDMVKSYNKRIKTFPTNLFASVFGFGQETYFEADESTKTVPKVEF